MTDVLVVGGGIIGLTVASRLQQRGTDVTIWTAIPYGTRCPRWRLPWWATAAGQATLTERELQFTAPLVEMDTYLEWLQRQVVDAGATIVRRRPASLAEALRAAPLVVNATGLAARELCGDPAVYPVRGHLVLVDNPGLDESVRDEDNPVGITYVHPRGDDVVLGGTFEEGRSYGGAGMTLSWGCANEVADLIRATRAVRPCR
jgi:D-amino-acid oxidase